MICAFVDLTKPGGELLAALLLRLSVDAAPLGLPQLIGVGITGLP